MHILITGTRVFTAEPQRPWAEAILIEDDTVVLAGSEAEARGAAPTGCEHVHVPGGLSVPGLNDAHIHMSYGANALTVLDLQGTVTLDVLQRRLAEYAAAHPDREWIEAFGLAYDVLAGVSGRERLVLDAAVPNRPVYLRAFDFHTAWVNTVALQRAGIERGRDLSPPNEVVVDEATGLATGVLKERDAYSLVASCIPPRSQSEADDALVEAFRHVNRQGITSVQIMDGTPEQVAQYRRLQDQGRLTLRAYHYLNMRPETPLDALDEFAALKRRYTGTWNRIAGIKLFMDGVVESKTAWMEEPYCDGSGDTGMPAMSPDRYSAVVRAADDLGLDIATHAIGARAVQFVLDTYQNLPPDGAFPGDRRHRVEHIEVINPMDIARFARLGVTASMQPLHAAPTTDSDDNLWAQLVGDDRATNAFPWQHLHSSGALLAFGSDWPIVTSDVREGLHTAVTRTNPRGKPRGGWHPEQCLTLAQALDGYTRGAARAERMESSKGMIRVGMLADVTVFGVDLFALAPHEIPQAEVAMTMVGGGIVHRSC